jgi:predicted amidohydrolase YtcJ
MEYFNFLGKDNPKMLALLGKLKQYDVTITPTLHVFAQPLGLTYFRGKPPEPFLDTSDWSKEQLERARKGYYVLASYVKAMHDKGIRLNIGTDSKNPGKAVLSEMLLLYDLGIAMEDVIAIASLNSAQAIGQEDSCGSVETGKKANLILFDKSPLQEARNLLSSKIVIKDGVVWKSRIRR